MACRCSNDTKLNQISAECCNKIFAVTCLYYYMWMLHICCCTLLKIQFTLKLDPRYKDSSTHFGSCRGGCLKPDICQRHISPTLHVGPYIVTCISCKPNTIITVMLFYWAHIWVFLLQCPTPHVYPNWMYRSSFHLPDQLLKYCLRAFIEATIISYDLSSYCYPSHTNLEMCKLPGVQWGRTNYITLGDTNTQFSWPCLLYLAHPAPSHQ